MTGVNAVQRSILLLIVLLTSCFGGVRGGNVLLQGYQIGVGAALVEGPYKFLMQGDCNLVLYKNGYQQVLWASNTPGRGSNCYFIMQTDGNAVVYSGSTAVFATVTNGLNDGNHYIILQSDGNCVMYNAGGKAIWATNTNGRK